MENIAFQVQMKDSYNDAVEKVIAALKDEGFGVLTTIDVKATLKQKLDEEFRPYVILGACNPPLAHRALSTDPKIGVMLPCNVTVEATEGGSLVSIANPEAMMLVEGLKNVDTLKEVAAEARTKLERVKAVLASS